MPSIEIISINSTGLNLNQKEFKFAIIEESEEIESHRGLYFDLLKTLSGTIIHIGNPEMIENIEDAFFGGKLVDWNFGDENKFQFLKTYENDFLKMLKIAHEKSPNKLIFFLTDYQFAGNDAKEIKYLTLEKFIEEYHLNGVEFNKLYKIEN